MTTVSVDPNLQRVIDRLTGGAFGVVRGAMENEARIIYTDARARWPVKTGRSRDALQMRVALEAEAVEVAITDYARVPKKGGGDGPLYAHFVRSLKVPNTGRAWLELVRKPMAAARKRLAQDLAEDLARLAGGG